MIRGHFSIMQELGKDRDLVGDVSTMKTCYALQECNRSHSFRLAAARL